VTETVPATDCTTGASPRPISTTLRRVLKEAAYRGMDTHPTIGGSFTTRDQTAQVGNSIRYSGTPGNKTQMTPFRFPQGANPHGDF